MINFFRKIRQKLLMENKTGKYLKYAIGEIVLVVIGILIALQINNWNTKKNNNHLEKRYLKNLTKELKKDSVVLDNIHKKLVYQSETKNPVIEMLENQQKNDSLIKYFSIQWRPIYPYTPLSSTFEEMKSSSHLSLIKSDKLREAIIKMYNSYESLYTDETFLLKYFEKLVDLLVKNVPDLYNPSLDDILKLGKNSQIVNSIRLNGAYSRRNNYKKVLEECSNLIKEINNYQQKNYD